MSFVDETNYNTAGGNLLSLRDDVKRELLEHLKCEMATRTAAVDRFNTLIDYANYLKVRGEHGKTVISPFLFFIFLVKLDLKIQIS
jgi:hypothetical protein